ncbi:MAG: hypothetical protein J5526_09180 [Bacteroidales bacterium]|nr:hypothetical protein [Bacteroidales bacterium]
MKRLFFMVAVALLTFGMASCERNGDDNGGSNNGNTPSNPTNPTTDDWVDLGLPSGLLWAKCNLGATTPEEYGNYYAWGEIASKSVYTWDTYTYGDDDGFIHIYKYNSSADYGTVDNKIVLEPDDDAASVALGAGARMPTQAEWQELIDNTTVEWTTENDVYGRKFTAANGNSLFLPAAGFRVDAELCLAGELGAYWSSSLFEEIPSGAIYLDFQSDGMNMIYFDRFYGRSVRAVRARQN